MILLADEPSNYLSKLRFEDPETGYIYHLANGKGTSYKRCTLKVYDDVEQIKWGDIFPPRFRGWVPTVSEAIWDATRRDPWPLITEIMLT